MGGRHFKTSLLQQFLNISFLPKFLDRFPMIDPIKLRPSILVVSFLALLCATAQQSYCRHAGVRRPSVKPVFSEPVKHINAKFGGKVPFDHISRPFFFQNFAFCIFLRFFFSFSLTWDHMVEKTSNDIFSESAHQICSTNSCILLGRVSTKVV